MGDVGVFELKNRSVYRAFLARVEGNRSNDCYAGYAVYGFFLLKSKILKTTAVTTKMVICYERSPELYLSSLTFRSFSIVVFSVFMLSVFVVDIFHYLPITC